MCAFKHLISKMFVKECSHICALSSPRGPFCLIPLLGLLGLEIVAIVQPQELLLIRRCLPVGLVHVTQQGVERHGIVLVLLLDSLPHLHSQLLQEFTKHEPIQIPTDM